jgi:hypothetical protein
MELGIVFRLSRSRVDVESTKGAEDPSAQATLAYRIVCHLRSPFIQLPFRRLVQEVLIPKNDDTSLGDKQGKLALQDQPGALRQHPPLRPLVELAELDTLDLAPKVGAQLGHLSALQEAPRLGVIKRRESRVGVLEWLQWRKLEALVVRGEEAGVLVVGTRNSVVGLRAVGAIGRLDISAEMENRLSLGDSGSCHGGVWTGGCFRLAEAD